MRLLASRFLGLLVLASIPLGCASARGIPIGEAAEPRPADCRIAYLHVTPAEAQDRWRQVGDVCVTPPGGETNLYAPGDARDMLGEQVCALGGDTVTPVGLCSNGRRNGVEFGVYLAHPASDW